MEAQSAVTTFLFTDIEGSSRLWEQHPEAMRPALARHDALVREAVEGNRGVVVKTTGDGVCAVFGDPLDAVRATLALQRQLADSAATAGVALRARCGVHAGVAQRRDDDYFGTAVNRAARIMSAAHGGQVLLSQAVVDLVRDRLPRDVRLRDLGSVRLRDLATPERLHQVADAAGKQDFPALRSLASTPNNLPQQVTSFVGRESELVEVRRMLTNSRLVTLHGAGGIGKTRLSLQVAAEVLDAFADGAWVVELAPLTDERRVAQTVAAVLGVKEDYGVPLADALVKQLKDLHALLILDNCEHVVAACAELAERLLRSCPDLRILASSREPLRVAGEAVYPVPALAVPEQDSAMTAEALARYEAVRLFSERAAAVTASFRLSPQTAAAVIEICRKLDGIPLAIELAAARTRALSVDAIASRLNDRFRLLTTGDRTALPRQQTLRALIDWSFDFLADGERALFRRLAVFAGGWTLEAAEAVASDHLVGTADVLDLLSALVDKSLVSVDPDGGRYRLLETVRQYAQERLDESAEVDAIRTRHLDFYLALAERTRGKLLGPEQVQGLALLDLERENILAALAWCDRAANGTEAGLKLVHATKHYWMIRGQLGLGYRVTTEAVARADLEPDDALRAQGLFNAGQLASYMGRHAEAQHYLLRSLDIARSNDDRSRIARVLQPLGQVALNQGNLEQARRYMDEALALAESLGDQRELLGAINSLGQLHRTKGDLDEAQPLYARVVQIGRALDDRVAVAVGLLNLAMVACARGVTRDASRMLLDVVAIAEEVGSKPAGQSVLDVCAGLACLLEAWERAARFYGMTEAQVRSLGIRRDGADEAFLTPQIAKARATLGDAAFRVHERAGAALAYEDALREAKSWLAERG